MKKNGSAAEFFNLHAKDYDEALKKLKNLWRKWRDCKGT